MAAGLRVFLSVPIPFICLSAAQNEAIEGKIHGFFFWSGMDLLELLALLVEKGNG